MATTLIIFGVTGDLVRLYVLASLFELYVKGLLSEDIKILGVSRRNWTDSDLRQYVEEVLERHKDHDKFRDFLRLFSYEKVELTTGEDYERLQKRLHELNTNNLFYFAISPEFYENVFHEFKRVGIKASSKDTWNRVLIEKPFGTNVASAQTLSELIDTIFKEEDIFRIDHYLVKNALEDLLKLRNNNLLKDYWNSTYIKKIHVNLLETRGVENRGDFYDSLGALKDVGQNHVLQMLAYATCDLSHQDLSEARKEVFEHMSVKEVIFDQYEGYTEIEGVKKDSKTETYFKIQGELAMPEWQGTGIVLESGKKMKAVRKSIDIFFTHEVKGVLDTLLSEGDIAPSITIDRDTCSITCSLQTPQELSPYAKIFLGVFDDKKKLFVSKEEVEEQWIFIDKVREMVDKNNEIL